MNFPLPLRAGAAALALAAISAPAHAAAIIGEISFTQGGAYVLSPALAPTTIPSATPLAALEFIAGSASVSGFGTDGVFSPAIGQPVVFTPSPYRFTDTGLLWTAGAFEFHAQSATTEKIGEAFHVRTIGFLRSPNFDDTPAEWVFTTQGRLSTVTWTSNVTVVPEPSLWLAGLAFQTGWFAFRRKRVA